MAALLDGSSCVFQSASAGAVQQQQPIASNRSPLSSLPDMPKDRFKILRRGFAEQRCGAIHDARFTESSKPTLPTGHPTAEPSIRLYRCSVSLSMNASAGALLISTSSLRHDQPTAPARALHYSPHFTWCRTSLRITVQHYDVPAALHDLCLPCLYLA